MFLTIILLILLVYIVLRLVALYLDDSIEEAMVKERNLTVNQLLWWSGVASVAYFFVPAFGPSLLQLLMNREEFEAVSWIAPSLAVLLPLLWFLTSIRSNSTPDGSVQEFLGKKWRENYPGLYGVVSLFETSVPYSGGDIRAATHLRTSSKEAGRQMSDDEVTKVLSTAPLTSAASIVGTTVTEIAGEVGGAELTYSFDFSWRVVRGIIYATLTPEKKKEIVGDVKNYFDVFCQKSVSALKYSLAFRLPGEVILYADMSTMFRVIDSLIRQFPDDSENEIWRKFKLAAPAVNGLPAREVIPPPAVDQLIGQGKFREAAAFVTEHYPRSASARIIAARGILITDFGIEDPNEDAKVREARTLLKSAQIAVLTRGQEGKGEGGKLGMKARQTAIGMIPKPFDKVKEADLTAAQQEAIRLWEEKVNEVSMAALTVLLQGEMYGAAKATIIADSSLVGQVLAALKK